MTLCCHRSSWFFGIFGLAAACWAGLAVIGDRSADQERGSIALKGTPSVNSSDDSSLATFGAGCFWCVEAVFEELEGVKSVSSGYTGGHVDNPTYRQVCDGTTGHAEVCRIEYDPVVISFEKLLEVFWATHDPTTLNRQGNDQGTQYRSAVFFHDDQQRDIATRLKKKLDESGAFGNPVVTEIVSLGDYYPAENYHQNYYAQNPDQGYCRAVIVPKMKKFRKVFAEDLKTANKR